MRNRTYFKAAKSLVTASIVISLGVSSPFGAMAAPVVPGSADSGRFSGANRPFESPSKDSPELQVPNVVPAVPIPDGADRISLVIKDIQLSGVTAFPAKEIQKLFAQDLNHPIMLSRIYELAAQITQYYRAAGYLLSYAYIPDQEIGGSVVKINVVEGAVETVTVEGQTENESKSIAGPSVLSSYINRITRERPSREQTIESTLLRMNDMPGKAYRAILLPDAKKIGAFHITLVPVPVSGQGSLSFDNFASRYLGPNEVSVNYSKSFLPLQKTSFYGLSSAPTDKLNYASIAHSWLVAPDLTLEGAVGYTHSQPGFSLTSLEVRSATTSLSMGLNYQLLRQRQKNLLLKLNLNARDVRSDFFGSTVLTRDHVRSVQAAVSYDFSDKWHGTNVANFTLSSGFRGLGASDIGAPNLSRSAARPDFKKLEVSYSRLQGVGDNWAFMLMANGQLASAPLYASEEFGVGGIQIGRAYDSSEIVGDSGFAGLIELRYTGLRTMQPINFEPYIYYDIGFVENRDAGQIAHESLASAGAGVRFATIWGQAGMLGLSFPLTHPIGAPVYGQSSPSPRILLQLTHSF